MLFFSIDNGFIWTFYRDPLTLRLEVVDKIPIVVKDGIARFQVDQTVWSLAGIGQIPQRRPDA